MEENFQDKIRISFAKVKEDMDILKKEMFELRNAFSSKNQDILMLKEQIKAQNELIIKLKEQIELFSIGNRGAYNDDKSSIMMHNDDQRSLLKPVTVEKFRSLTDREFSVFLAIYQLEEENGASTYINIALKLGITIQSARVYVNDLIQRGYPIYGEREFNRKIKFRILKEFRDQNMISEVLTLREIQNTKSPSI